MRLNELEVYEPITVQCHDNPDGDALASGFGLYRYFKSKGKVVRLIYSGANRIQKTNLKLMVEKLAIPVEYVPKSGAKLPGLLITVDCQYGAGNVTKFEAENVAVIDHHQIEMENIRLGVIHSKLGSCSTLVWKLLTEEGYPVREDQALGTALYYGLYTDTNQFAEIRNPLDMDMRDSLTYNQSLITLFRNSNLSLQELEIAGIAMIRYIFNDDYNYAIIKAQPCDPNILGLISDFLIQVDEVYTCVVYNETGSQYKISVRSCVKEVKASELVSYLCEDIGSGGGHTDKAGGVISRRLYEGMYPTLHSEAYFSQRMNDYFDHCDIIYAQDYRIDLTDMPCYRKKKYPVGYVKAVDVLPVGTPITIRTLEGDVDMTVATDLYIMIGIKGEVYPNKKEKFERSYRMSGAKDLKEGASLADYIINKEYTPTVINRLDGSTKELMDYAGICLPTGEVQIRAKQLAKRVKIFTSWDTEKYMLGKPGDYLAVRCDDYHDIYVLEQDIFNKTYELVLTED